MKLSVSLPAEDVEFVDAYIERTGEPSRSAAIHHAIECLRAASLEYEYASAFDEWDEPEWDTTAADGLADAAR
jgi:Arc/MetJ-type ribon-helix-helix transcriptional regulator